MGYFCMLQRGMVDSTNDRTTKLRNFLQESEIVVFDDPSSIFEKKNWELP